MGSWVYFCIALFEETSFPGEWILNRANIHHFLNSWNANCELLAKFAQPTRLQTNLPKVEKEGVF